MPVDGLNACARRVRLAACDGRSPVATRCDCGRGETADVRHNASASALGGRGEKPGGAPAPRGRPTTLGALRERPASTGGKVCEWCEFSRQPRAQPGELVHLDTTEFGRGVARRPGAHVVRRNPQHPLIGSLEPLIGPLRPPGGGVCRPNSFPTRRRTVAGRGDQPSGPQRFQVPDHLAFADVRSQSHADVSPRQPITGATDQGEDHPSSLGWTGFAAVGVRHGLAVSEPHDDGPAVILDLRDRQPRLSRHVHHLQRSAAPRLNDPAPVVTCGRSGDSTGATRAARTAVPASGRRAVSRRT